MLTTSNSEPERLLPTYRWDEKEKLSNSELELRRLTSQRLVEYIHRSTELSSGHFKPPEGIIRPIVAMNVRKRTSAMRSAESLIANGQMVPPPPSLIPTFMASGHTIPGVEDGYMKNDHPSQELFAYNRLGKKSWLNKRFGAHCLKAIGFAHPHGEVMPALGQSRAKAHAPATSVEGLKCNGLDDWVIVSTKTPIATIHENGRRAALISRVTGAVDLTSPELSAEEAEAIRLLSVHEAHPEYNEVNSLGQKALLLDAIESNENSDENPFYPVIQTVYLTQLQ